MHEHRKVYKDSALGPLRGGKWDGMEGDTAGNTHKRNTKVKRKEET
jgi:hypothetical protein